MNVTGLGVDTATVLLLVSLGTALPLALARGVDVTVVSAPRY